MTGENAAAGGPTWAYCSREENAASKDPGTFTVGSEQWVAVTVAVRPAAAVGGRIMSSLAAAGGLAGTGGIAGSGGGLAG